MAIPDGHVARVEVQRELAHHEVLEELVQQHLLPLGIDVYAEDHVVQPSRGELGRQ